MPPTKSALSRQENWQTNTQMPSKLYIYIVQTYAKQRTKTQLYKLPGSQLLVQDVPLNDS